MDRRTETPAPSSHRAARKTNRRWMLPVAVFLAFLAFFLSPTGHANMRDLVNVNGLLVSVAPGTTVDEVAGEALALARPGSELDILGDVTKIGQGSPGDMTMNGRPARPEASFTDGAVLTVSHGPHHLEGVVSKEQRIPFETVVEGKGAVVSLAQVGKPGAKETYLGAKSGKQAALFTLASPQNAVIKRSGSPQSGQKLVALTFDDGPGRYTQGVLDALASRKVPATFFVLGGNAAGQQGMIETLRAGGHQVENHTWGHPILTQISTEQIQKEIARTSAVIGGSRYLRPPYGTYDARVAAAAGAMDHKLVLWTVDTLDWKTRNADAILAKVKEGTKPGAIILMHDGGNDRSQTVAAIPRVIDWLFANGYSLTTVAKLLQG